jgi:hypothetical protein
MPLKFSQRPMDLSDQDGDQGQHDMQVADDRVFQVVLSV